MLKRTILWAFRQYPAFYRVIDVVNRIIPGHGFTFLSADWGEKEESVNPVRK